jgi:hypothetical protein
LREGVRVQRKQYFDYKLLDLTKCKIIQSSLKKLFCQWFANGDLARTIIPNRKLEQEKSNCKKIKGKGYSYLIEMNNYIGNPK